MMLVTGATGTLGRLVVAELRSRGHEVRALSRRAHTPEPGLTWYTANLTTGEGLAEALAGVDTVIHAASDSRHPNDDLVAARNLVRAAGDAHIVFISIVGVDRIPYRYFTVKYAVERLLEREASRYTILRATQFHDLLYGVLKALGKSPVVPVLSGVPFQTVSAREVAVRLVGLAEGEPLGRVPDLGGPEVLDFARAAREYYRGRRLVVPLRLPGKMMRAFRTGYQTCPEHADGEQTWDEYLSTTERLSSAA